jgi:hypothetical protein
MHFDQCRCSVVCTLYEASANVVTHFEIVNFVMDIVLGHERQPLVRRKREFVAIASGRAKQESSLLTIQPAAEQVLLDGRKDFIA